MSDIPAFITYGPEIFVGVVLIVFGFAFRSWASTVRDSSTHIIQKLETMAKEIHQHRLDTERRLVRMETEIKLLLAKEAKRNGNNGNQK